MPVDNSSGVESVRPATSPSLIHLDKNLVTLDGNRESIRVDSRVIDPGSVTHIETPRVQGAGDDAAIQFAGAQAGTHVGASIVNCVERTLALKNCDDPVVDFERTSFAFGDLVRFGDKKLLGHGWLVGKELVRDNSGGHKDSVLWQQTGFRHLRSWTRADQSAGHQAGTLVVPQGVWFIR